MLNENILSPDNCAEGRSEHCWHSDFDLQVSHLTEKIQVQRCCWCPAVRNMRMILKSPDGHGSRHPFKIWVVTGEEVTLEVVGARGAR
jgi:hypothetical protein